MIMCGALLSYISVFFNSNTAQHSYCTMWELCAELGPTLYMAALIAKTWRLHKIFNNRHMYLQKRVSITDRDLVQYIIVMFSIPLLLVVIRAVIGAADPRYLLQPVARLREGSIFEMDIRCSVLEGDFITFMIFAYRVLLLFLGCVLAYLTRTITVPFHDSHWVGVALYSCTLILLTLGFLRHFTNPAGDLVYVYSSLMAILSGLSITCLLLLPKLFQLKMMITMSDLGIKSEESTAATDTGSTRNARGKLKHDVETEKASDQLLSVQGLLTERNDEVANLKVEVTRLRKRMNLSRVMNNSRDGNTSTAHTRANSGGKQKNAAAKDHRTTSTGSGASESSRKRTSDADSGAFIGRHVDIEMSPVNAKSGSTFEFVQPHSQQTPEKPSGAVMIAIAKDRVQSVRFSAKSEEPDGQNDERVRMDRTWSDGGY